MVYNQRKKQTAVLGGGFSYGQKVTHAIKQPKIQRQQQTKKHPQMAFAYRRRLLFMWAPYR
jgi:hypothetical protein